MVVRIEQTKIFIAKNVDRKIPFVHPLPMVLQNCLHVTANENILKTVRKIISLNHFKSLNQKS